MGHCPARMSVSGLMLLSNGPATRRASTRRMARLAWRRAASRAAVLRPRELGTQLAVSASTLRVWSTEFKDYLSPCGARTARRCTRHHNGAGSDQVRDRAVRALRPASHTEAHHQPRVAKLRRNGSKMQESLRDAWRDHSQHGDQTTPRQRLGNGRWGHWRPWSNQSRATRGLVSQAS